MSTQGDLLKLGIDTIDLADVNFFNGVLQTFTQGKVGLISKSSSLIDDASYDITPKGPGFLLVAAEDDEAVLIAFEAGGTVLKVAGTSNTADTDSDTDLSVFKSSANVRVRNRLGSTKVVTTIGFWQQA